MKIFLRFLREYPRESILAPLFKLLEACFDLCVPLVIAAMIDRGIGPEGGTGDRPFIIWMTLVLVGLAMVGLVCALSAQYFAARSAVGTAAKLRHELFAHLQSFTYTQTDHVGTSTMITRLTSDINQLQSGMNMTMRLMLRSPIIVVGAAIMAFTIDPDLAWIFVIAIPVLALVVFGIMLGGIPLYRKVQSRLDAVMGITRENLAGVRVIRAFRKEKEEITDFETVNREQTHLQNRAGLLTALMNPITYVLVNLAVVVLIQQGAFAVDSDRITQGEVVALVNYMAQILVELVKLASTVFLVTKAVACGNRVGDVLDMPAGYPAHAVGDVLDMPAGTEIRPDGTMEASATTPAVVFDHVSLTYEGGGAPSLHDISFAVNRGQTVGIIGGTGSGKTTLCNLIPRFYDATEGSVKVFGRDVQSYDLAELRTRIGVVPQKAELFKGTVRSNLQWGDENATDEMLWQALADAQASDFIRDKEGQLEAVVEQKGRNFSGGQKQRLTIARALVGRPDILILDDSSSALDFATDAKLRHAIRHLAHKPTTFIISQRTSSIRHAELIIVLDEGHAVGMGTHDELLTSCDTYREIHESQFKGGEAK